jgi:hypothetical protein
MKTDKSLEKSEVHRILTKALSQMFIDAFENFKKHFNARDLNKSINCVLDVIFFSVELNNWELFYKSYYFLIEVIMKFGQYEIAMNLMINLLNFTRKSVKMEETVEILMKMAAIC